MNRLRSPARSPTTFLSNCSYSITPTTAACSASMFSATTIWGTRSLRRATPLFCPPPTTALSVAGLPAVHQFGLEDGASRRVVAAEAMSAVFQFLIEIIQQKVSDPASRRAPVPRRMVPVLTVHKGLTPLESDIILDTPGENACPTRAVLTSIECDRSHPSPTCRRG